MQQEGIVAVSDRLSSCVLQMHPAPQAPAPSNIIPIPAAAANATTPPHRSFARYHSSPSANTLPHDTAALLCEEVVVAAPRLETKDGAISLTPTSVTSRWRCKVCGKETDYKSNTLRHIRVAHTANTYRCVCGVEFKWSDSLKKHRRKCAAAAAAASAQTQQVHVHHTSASIMASVVSAATGGVTGTAGVMMDEQGAEVTSEQLYSSMTG